MMDGTFEPFSCEIYDDRQLLRNPPHVRMSGRQILDIDWYIDRIGEES